MESAFKVKNSVVVNMIIFKKVALTLHAPTSTNVLSVYRPSIKHILAVR